MGYFDIFKSYKAVDKLIKKTFISAGTIWYVHGFNGKDTNPGNTALAPLLTIDAALAKCVAQADDYIIVLDCWDQDTFPITVDVERVHIIGLDMGAGFPRMSAPADTAVFNITKDYAEIAGFGPDAPAQTIAHGVIELKTSAVGRANIHHNFFGCFGASYNAIVLAEGPEAWIHDNVFGEGLVGKGIVGQSTRGRFNTNRFHRIGGICINITAGVFSEIIGNKFAIKTDGSGSAITLGASCQGGGLIDDNRAGYLEGAITTPYRDLGTPKANWLLNYGAQTAIAPATV